MPCHFTMSTLGVCPHKLFSNWFLEKQALGCGFFMLVELYLQTVPVQTVNDRL